MATGQNYVSERKVLTELLELYRNCPCLWDPNHDYYNNSWAKETAIALMLDKYRLLEEYADADALKKKIDSMRTSYRRERKKVMLNQDHTPSLWYYNLLTFLNDDTTFAAATSTSTYQSDGDDDDEINFESSDEADTNQLPKRFKPTGVLILEHSEAATNKRNAAVESDAFGRSLGLQLNELGPMQKTIAEKLISDVIYYARLDKLTTQTSLINLNNDVAPPWLKQSTD